MLLWSVSCQWWPPRQHHPPPSTLLNPAFQNHHEYITLFIFDSPNSPLLLTSLTTNTQPNNINWINSNSPFPLAPIRFNLKWLNSTLLSFSCFQYNQVPANVHGVVLATRPKILWRLSVCNTNTRTMEDANATIYLLLGVWLFVRLSYYLFLLFSISCRIFICGKRKIRHSDLV